MLLNTKSEVQIAFDKVGKNARLQNKMLKYEGPGKKNPSKAVVCGFLWVLLGLNLPVGVARTAMSLEEQKYM